MNTTTTRRGYAMVLVLVFIAVAMAISGVAFRHIASELRTLTSLEIQRRRDEGSMRALARGLALLETGFPSSDPYVCGTTIDTAAGSRTFTVTFAAEGARARESRRWSVHVAPTAIGEYPPAMPQTFAGS